VVAEPVGHHAEMRTASIAITVAGAFCGGLTLVLLLGGWLGLVPYTLMAAGALFIAAAITGALSR
jgi:hypothetical protein